MSNDFEVVFDDAPEIEYYKPILNKKLKVCVYAISKNEETFAARCIASALEGTKGADLFLLADTGSEDKTVEVARAAGATVHSITVSPWRFDTARNAALSLIPSDVDICVSIDLDEVLQPGWRLEVERLFTEKPDTTRLRYKYDWSCDVVFYSEKIHTRKGYLWKHPCHERVVPDSRLKEVITTSDKLLIQHLPDQSKDRSSYLPLLEVGIKENRKDKRNILYYARELTFIGRDLEAIELLKEYLKNPEYDWKEEAAYAHTLIGDAHERLGDHEQARQSYLQGIVAAPRLRKAWLALAAHARDRDWQECLYASEQALKITKRDFMYFDDGSSWGEKPYMLASLSCYYLGYFSKAKEYGEKAIELAPHEKYLKDNLKFFLDKVKD